MQLWVLFPGSVPSGRGLLGRRWGHEEVPEGLSSMLGTAEIWRFPHVPGYREASELSLETPV